MYRHRKYSICCYIWVNIHFRTSYELIAEQQKTRSELIHAIAIQAEETMVRMGYITGWWLTYPSEKYEFVSWDDDIPNIWKVIKFMFQTTNQYIYIIYIYISYIPWNIPTMVGYKSPSLVQIPKFTWLFLSPGSLHYIPFLLLINSCEQCSKPKMSFQKILVGQERDSHFMDSDNSRKIINEPSCIISTVISSFNHQPTWVCWANVSWFSPFSLWFSYNVRPPR